MISLTDLVLLATTKKDVLPIVMGFSTLIVFAMWTTPFDKDRIKESLAAMGCTPISIKWRPFVGGIFYHFKIEFKNKEGDLVKKIAKVDFWGNLLFK